MQSSSDHAFCAVVDNAATESMMKEIKNFLIMMYCFLTNAKVMDNRLK
jgi:hypothetical protein